MSGETAAEYKRRWRRVNAVILLVLFVITLMAGWKALPLWVLGYIVYEVTHNKAKRLQERERR